MKFALIAIISLAVASAAAQELTERQKTEMAACALHGGGGWVEPSLFADGRVRFSYALEPSEAKGSRDLYVVFWDSTQTKGTLLVFDLSKTSHHKDLFTIKNEGHVWDNGGQPDVSDALGGMYIYRQIKGLLPKLKQQQATVRAVGEIPAMSGACVTPVDK